MTRATSARIAARVASMIAWSCARAEPGVTLVTLVDGFDEGEQPMMRVCVFGPFVRNENDCMRGRQTESNKPHLFLFASSVCVVRPQTHTTRRALRAHIGKNRGAPPPNFQSSPQTTIGRRRALALSPRQHMSSATSVTPLRQMHSSRRRLDIFEHMPTTATPANRRCSPVCTDLSPHIEALLDADVLAFCKAVSKQGTPVASGRAVAMPTLELRSPPLVKALNPKAAEWQPPPMAAESSAPPSPTAAGGAKRKDAKSLNVDAPEFCPAGGWQQGDDAPTATAMAAQIRAMAQELEAATKRAAQAEAALSCVQGTARAQREELEQEVERLRAAANEACAAQREKREADDLRRRTAMLGDEVCELHAQKDGLASQLAREQGERARLRTSRAPAHRAGGGAPTGSVATLASLQNELAALRIAVNQPASAYGSLRRHPRP